MIRFQQSNIEKIRRDYHTHILYVSINQYFPRAISGRYALSTEQVFVEVIRLLDVLKEQQEDVQWDNLYGYLQDECARSCNDISEEELHAVTSTIIVALAGVLSYSPFRIYKDIGKKLVSQYGRQNQLEEQRKKILHMAEGMDMYAREICVWIMEYMQSAEFVSSRLKQYVEQGISCVPVHRFKYLINDVPENIVREIDSKLHIAVGKAHASKELVRLLRYEYGMYIDVFGVSAKDVWQEFHDNYGLTQSYATFSNHYPQAFKTK